jgi:hypothetical protein
MKITIIFLSLFCLFTCDTKSNENKKVTFSANPHDTISNMETPVVMESKAIGNEESVYFVIVADTSVSFPKIVRIKSLKSVIFFNFR